MRRTSRGGWLSRLAAKRQKSWVWHPEFEPQNRKPGKSAPVTPCECRAEHGAPICRILRITRTSSHFTCGGVFLLFFFLDDELLVRASAVLKSLGPGSWSRGRPGSSSFFRTLPVQHHRKQNTKQNPSSAACCCSRVRRSIPHINHPTKEPAPPASILISVPVGLWVFMLPKKKQKKQENQDLEKEGDEEMSNLKEHQPPSPSSARNDLT